MVRKACRIRHRKKPVKPLVRDHPAWGGLFAGSIPFRLGVAGSRVAAGFAEEAPAGPGTLAPRPCGSVGPNAGGAIFSAEVLALITFYQVTDIARYPVSILIYNRRGIFNRSADLLLEFEEEILPFRLPRRGRGWHFLLLSRFVRHRLFLLITIRRLQ